MIKLLIFFISLTIQKKCPDMKDILTEKVKNNFDLKKLGGIWYEQNYIDLAQIGFKCQMINNTIIDKNYLQEFSGKYSFVPFSLNLQYDAQDQNGIFTRYEQSVSSIKFTTIILDYVEDNEGNYIGYSDYLCLDLGVTHYEEIRFISRERNGQAPESMFITAEQQVQGFNRDQLKLANQINC